MPDITLTPIINSGVDPKVLQFKVKCGDVVVLESVKKMLFDMLMKKDFIVDAQVGYNETNRY